MCSVWPCSIEIFQSVKQPYLLFPNRAGVGDTESQIVIRIQADASTLPTCAGGRYNSNASRRRRRGEDPPPPPCPTPKDPKKQKREKRKE